MSGNAGNSKTGSLLQRNTFGQRNSLLQRNNRVLGGGSKRTVRLSAIAPYSPSDPVPRYIFSNRVNGTRPVAVRYDPRVRHTDAKRILAFLHITWIYTGKSDTNPHLARAGVRVLHVTKGQNIPRSTLPFIPSRFHGFEYLRVFGTFFTPYRPTSRKSKPSVRDSAARHPRRQAGLSSEAAVLRS